MKYVELNGSKIHSQAADDGNENWNLSWALIVAYRRCSVNHYVQFTHRCQVDSSIRNSTSAIFYMHYLKKSDTERSIFRQSYNDVSRFTIYTNHICTSFL